MDLGLRLVCMGGGDDASKGGMEGVTGRVGRVLVEPFSLKCRVRVSLLMNLLRSMNRLNSLMRLLGQKLSPLLSSKVSVSDRMYVDKLKSLTVSVLSCFRGGIWCFCFFSWDLDLPPRFPLLFLLFFFVPLG